MDKSNALALLHLETGLKLTSIEFVTNWLSTQQQLALAPAAGGRGRKPGAAPPGSRCTWSLGDGSQCKNARTDQNSFCKIHLAKVHLVDPSTSA
jgi:hypothetical protein